MTTEEMKQIQEIAKQGQKFVEDCYEIDKLVSAISNAPYKWSMSQQGRIYSQFHRSCLDQNVTEDKTIILFIEGLKTLKAVKHLEFQSLVIPPTSVAPKDSDITKLKAAINNLIAAKPNIEIPELD